MISVSDKNFYFGFSRNVLYFNNYYKRSISSNDDCSGFANRTLKKRLNYKQRNVISKIYCKIILIRNVCLFYENIYKIYN